MNKLILSISFILLSFSLTAPAAPSERLYTILGKSYSFRPIQGVYVSEGCLKKCAALERLLKSKEVPPRKKGFLKSKASRICEELKGKSVFGVNQQKDMMAFCVFPDESMIEYRSLENYKFK